MDTQYKYLKLVKYSSLLLWDIKRLSNSALKYRYDIIPLKDILSVPKMEWVEIENEKEYPILGVHAHGEGVYINRVAKGRELTMKQYQKSKPMHLFYCKVRTVNGQWGVVWPEFADSYGSSNMQYLAINQEKINPRYLELLLRVKSITREWDKNAVGADGRHFPLKTLMNLTIPLPSMEEQNAIIAAYNTVIEQANICTSAAHGVDAEIEDYLHNILGTNIELNQNDSLLSFVHYKDISRWDPLFLLSSSNIHSKYQLVTLSTCINNFLSDENGVSLRIETQKTPTQEYRYIGMENVEKETGRVVDAPIVKGKEIKSQTIKVPTKYFIYGKLRPYLNKYWYNDSEQPEEIICSSEFFVFDIKDNINTNYFKYVLASYIVQKQIVDAMSGARMPRISEDTFRNIQIPLPPLDLQNEIVEHITLLREKQKTMIEQAKERRKQAAQQFEQTIFE